MTATQMTATQMTAPNISATRIPPLSGADAEFFSAARLRAARLQPYLASAVFSLVPVAEPGYGTFGVDRWWRVYLDMDKAREWGIAATAAVILHEAHHVVRDHHARADRISVEAHHAHLWNLAGDAAINDDLLEDGLALPSPVLPKHLGLQTGLLEETYFRHLLEQEEQDQAQKSCGSGSGGTPLESEIDQEPDSTDPAGPQGIDQVEAQAIRRAVAHDVVAAQGTGQNVSPGLVLWAQDLLNPQVPWQSLLRSALGSSARAITSKPQPDWARPDRRSDSRPEFPRPGSRHLRPQVAVVIDTSYSMSRPLLNAAVTEINALLQRFGVSELIVVVCDAAATPPQRVRRIGELALSGGGGTDLRVGIAAAAECRPSPQIIVVLTDGFTPWPQEAPARTKLIAIIIGDHAPLPEGTGITSLRIKEPR